MTSFPGSFRHSRDKKALHAALYTLHAAPYIFNPSRLFPGYSLALGVTQSSANLEEP